MRVLLDSTILMEGERQRFDLGRWAQDQGHELLICDAGVTEYLAGRPVKDAGKEARFIAYWKSFLSLLPSVPLDREVCERAGDLLARARKSGKTVPLGDGLHGAVADLEGLTVATVDTNHFDDLKVSAFNPLIDPTATQRAS